MTQDDIQFHIEQDRKRVKSILALPEAAGREKLAAVLAYQANMEVDDARAALRAAPLPLAALEAVAKPDAVAAEFDWNAAGVAAAEMLLGKRGPRVSSDQNEGKRAAQRLLGKPEDEDDDCDDSVCDNETDREDRAEDASL